MPNHRPPPAVTTQRGRSRKRSFIRILPLGDSLTLGISPSSTSTDQPWPGGYRGPLQELLGSRTGFADNFAFVGTILECGYGPCDDTEGLPPRITFHEGHAGFTTARTFGTSPGNLLDIVTSWVPGDSSADIILLQVGINDIIAQGATARELATDLNALLAALFSRISQPDTYVATLAMNNPRHPHFQELLLFNDLLGGELVPSWQKAGHNLHCVDMFAALRKTDFMPINPFYEEDAVHPNTLGYAAMAQAWNEALTTPRRLHHPADHA